MYYCTFKTYKMGLITLVSSWTNRHGHREGLDHEIFPATNIYIYSV